MLIKQNDFEIASGRLIKNAEFREVGEKHTHLCKFAISASPTTIVNVNAWFDLADNTKGLKKNDRVIVAGTVITNEYEGKTYYNLNADCVCIGVINTLTDDNMDTLDSNDIPF